MQLPLQVTFRNMDPSAAIEANIQERVNKLDAFYDRIMGCRVVVEAPHRHHHKGKQYHVRIDLSVPGQELVVNHDPGRYESHEDAYVAVRDAFDAIRRQLEDHHRREKRKVKTHEAPPHGKISLLAPDEDYGRIETPHGRDIYFHRNSLINANFDELEVGAEVRFHEEDGENGPQASSVSLIGKHHIVG